MEQEESWLEMEAIDPSNCELFDHNEVQMRGTLSVIKNYSLASILSSRPPSTRTEKECRAIADLLKIEPYFQSMAKSLKTLVQVGSWIEYRQAQSGEYFFRVHDVADNFYILLQGEVHLTFPEKEVLEVEVSSLEQNDANSTKNLKESAFYPTAVPILIKNQSVSPFQAEEERSKPKRLTRHESLLTAQMIKVQPPSPKKLAFEQRIVQIVTHGEGFGDLQSNNRRGTNAIAKEMCHVLVVKRQHYSTLSSAHVKSQSKQKYELLSSIPLFQMLYRYALESLIYLMEEHKVGYNHVVYNEEESTRYVYVIFKGEFKLYKKVQCRKEAAASSTDIQERTRNVARNVSFKTVQLGEILGYAEAYQKIAVHQETCVCKSQEGLVLRIDKNKFIKKLISTENNLQEIVSFIEQKCVQRSKEMHQFLRKYESNHLFMRFLHTPSAKARRVNTESSVYKQRSQRKDELRKLSTGGNNFFNEFNKTVKQEVRSTRISIKKSIHLGEIREAVPSRIKDIIGIVDQETNYYKIRKPKENITLFDFNISNVPIHVKKKYGILFKKQNK